MFLGPVRKRPPQGTEPSDTVTPMGNWCWGQDNRHIHWSLQQDWSSPSLRYNVRVFLATPAVAKVYEASCGVTA